MSIQKLTKTICDMDSSVLRATRAAIDAANRSMSHSPALDLQSALANDPQEMGTPERDNMREVTTLATALQRSNANLRSCHVALRAALDSRTAAEERLISERQQMNEQFNRYIRVRSLTVSDCRSQFACGIEQGTDAVGSTNSTASQRT